MTGIILETLGLYLSGDIELDSLEDRIIPLLWSVQQEVDRNLIAEIAAELVYIKDGLSDEAIFKARMKEIVILEQVETIIVNFNMGEPHVKSQLDDRNASTEITYKEPVAPIDYHFSVQPDLQPAASTRLS